MRFIKRIANGNQAERETSRTWYAEWYYDTFSLGQLQSEIRTSAYNRTLPINYTHEPQATDGMTRYSVCLMRNSNAQHAQGAEDLFDWASRTIAAYFTGHDWMHVSHGTPVVYRRRTADSTTGPAVGVSGGVRPPSQVSSNQPRIYTQMPAPAGNQSSRQFAQNHQPSTPHSVVPYAQPAPRLPPSQPSSLTTYNYIFAFAPDASSYSQFRAVLNGIQGLTVTSGGRWRYSTTASGGWIAESYMVAVPRNAAQTAVSRIDNYLNSPSFPLIEINGRRIWEFSPAEIGTESSIRGARSSTPAASARNLDRQKGGEDSNKQKRRTMFSAILKLSICSPACTLFICNAMDISNGRSHAGALTVLRATRTKSSIDHRLIIDAGSVLPSLVDTVCYGGIAVPMHRYTISLMLDNNNGGLCASASAEGMQDFMHRQIRKQPGVRVRQETVPTPAGPHHFIISAKDQGEVQHFASLVNAFIEKGEGSESITKPLFKLPDANVKGTLTALGWVQQQSGTISYHWRWSPVRKAVAKGPLKPLVQLHGGRRGSFMGPSDSHLNVPQPTLRTSTSSQSLRSGNNASAPTGPKRASIANAGQFVVPVQRASDPKLRKTASNASLTRRR